MVVNLVVIEHSDRSNKHSLAIFSLTHTLLYGEEINKFHHTNNIHKSCTQKKTNEASRWK